MKKSICLAVSLLALNITPGFAQQTPNSDPYLEMTAAEKPALTKFNLDFPGGTPKELVAAIEKAMGKPLNVIIPDEDASTILPPLKLNDITFPQLSDTLRVGSSKVEYVEVRDTYFPGGKSTRAVELGYYFKTTDERPTDNSVWFFRVAKKPEQPPQPPAEKVSRFYSLSPYLNSGLTVDDITTAIQTGWRMSGDNSPPELNYHKETKLLMAYGEPAKLKIIDDVLVALQPSAQDSSQRLQNIFNNSPRPVPVALPPRFTPSLLSPEAQAISVEQNRAQSTNPPVEIPGK